MATEIESMTVRLSGNATGYERMLSGAQALTKSAAGNMSNAVGGVRNVMNQLDVGATFALRNVASGLTGMSRATVSTIAAFSALSRAQTLVGLGGLTVTASLTGFKNAVTDLEKADDQARRLGLSFNELETVTTFAGVGVDKIGKAVEGLQSKLSGLRTGSAAAKADFAGLSELSGVPVERLTGATGRDLAGAAGAARDALGGLRPPPANDFLASLDGITDALMKIPDPAVRAAQAYRFLGDAAYPVLARLEAGGRTVAGSRGLVERMGLGITPGEMAAIRQVNQTVRDLGTVSTGVFRQMVVGIAPFVNALAKAFAPGSLNLNWIKDAAASVAKTVIMLGSYFGAAMRDSSLFWDAMEVGLLKVKAALIGTTAEVIKLFQTMAGGETKYYGIDDAFLDTVGRLFGGSGSGGPGRLGGDAASFDKAAKAASAEADRLAANLKKKLEATPEAKKGRSVIGDATSAIDEFNKKLSQGPPAESVVRKYEDMFARIRDAAKGPVETFTEGLRDLQEMTRLGLFAGKAGEQLRQLQAGSLFRGLVGGVGIQAAPQLAGAAEARSREAYSAAAQWAALGQMGTVQERMRQAIEIGNQQKQALIDIGRELLGESKQQTQALTDDSGGSL